MFDNRSARAMVSGAPEGMDDMENISTDEDGAEILPF